MLKWNDLIALFENEQLSQHYWLSIDAVQIFGTQRYKYNLHRPNMALGDFTLKQRLTMTA